MKYLQWKIVLLIGLASGQDAKVGFLVIGHDTDRGGMSRWARPRQWRDAAKETQMTQRYPRWSVVSKRFSQSFLFSCVLRSLGSRSLWASLPRVADRRKSIEGMSAVSWTCFVECSSCHFLQEIPEWREKLSCPHNEPHLSPTLVSHLSLTLWVPWAAWVYACLPLVSRTCLPLWVPWAAWVYTRLPLVFHTCLPAINAGKDAEMISFAAN